MKKTIVFLTILAIVVNGYSQQTPPENTLNFSAGFNHLTRQDLIFSPFIHRDVSAVNIGVSYSRIGRLYQQASLRYTSFAPVLAEPYSYFDLGEQKTAGPHHFTMVDIDYFLGKRILQKSKSSTTIGGLISTDIQLLNYVYGRIGNTGYVFSFGMGAFMKQDFQISEKGTLSAELQMPLFFWLARSPYLVNDDEYIENISSHSDLKSFAAFINDGSVATIERFQSLDVGIGYAYQINPKWQIGTDYRFEFMYASAPRNLLSFRNSINLSANFIF